MRTSRCTSWVSKTQRNQRPSCQHSMDHGESKGVPKKQSTSASWVMLKPLCDHNKLWKILRDGDTRPPYLSPEKSVCRPRSNNQNLTWSNWLVPNLLRSTTRLSTVTVLIICRVRHGNARLEESQAGIKIARRNIKNFRYAHDITLMGKVKRN